MQLINTVAIVAALAANVFAQSGLNIQTPPSVVQCQPAQLNYGGGQGPYFITILPGGQVGAASMEDLGEQTGSMITWVADIPQGTSITFQIRDQTGQTAFSAIVTIQSSSDSSCIGKNSASSSGSSTGSGSGSTSAGSSSSGASSAPASTTAASTSAGSTTAAPGSSSGSSPASTKPASSATSGSATTGSAAASTSSNAAVALNSGSAVGIISFLLAAVIA